MADALFRLGHDPVFISAIGDDIFGRELIGHFKKMNMVRKIMTTTCGIYNVHGYTNAFDVQMFLEIAKIIESNSFFCNVYDC